MQIVMTVTISSGPLNDVSLEALRMTLRRELLPFVFKCAEATPIGAGFTTIKRQDLNVDGTILMKD